ncbi:hypothetical protein Vi05172_g12890 [Venturia inaequalis]|nr:hypothetical protein Vi05172_g12890 [Venturia inaequalis]
MLVTAILPLVSPPMASQGKAGRQEGSHNLSKSLQGLIAGYRLQDGLQWDEISDKTNVPLSTAQQSFTRARDAAEDPNDLYSILAVIEDKKKPQGPPTLIESGSAQSIKIREYQMSNKYSQFDEAANQAVKDNPELFQDYLSTQMRRGANPQESSASNRPILGDITNSTRQNQKIPQISKGLAYKIAREHRDPHFSFKIVKKYPSKKLFLTPEHKQHRRHLCNWLNRALRKKVILISCNEFLVEWGGNSKRKRKTTQAQGQPSQEDPVRDRKPRFKQMVWAAVTQGNLDYLAGIKRPVYVWEPETEEQKEMHTADLEAFNLIVEKELEAMIEESV